MQKYPLGLDKFQWYIYITMVGFLVGFGIPAVFAQEVPVQDLPIDPAPIVDTAIYEITETKEVSVFKGTIEQLEKRKEILRKQIEKLQLELSILENDQKTKI